MKVKRQKAIDMLVDRDFNEFNMGDLSLDEILRTGFNGYNTYTNKQLQAAYNDVDICDEEIEIVDTEDYNAEQEARQKELQDELAGKFPDEINISWHIEDVKSMEGYGDITDEEARKVLYLAKSNHDATIGINWETLEVWADHVRNERQRQE